MEELNVTITDTLQRLIEAKKYTSAKDILATMNPSDIATLFDDLEEQVLPILFRLLPKELAADAFVEMEPEHQELLIKGFSDTELKQVINEMYVDEAVDIVEEMPANVVRRILSQASPDMRKDINEILRYPEDSAGSEMTTEYVSLRISMTVGDAIAHIRKTGIDKETIYTCYITNNRKLVGYVSVKDLLLAKDDSIPVSEIMEENVIFCHTSDDREDVAQMFSKYNFIALPVVDSEDRMVGIITVDDALDVIEEETTEDFVKMSGQTPYEKTYLRTSPFGLFKHRILWLMILMLSSTFTSMIITHYENALAAYVILTAFIPMLMGTGGNSGSQSSVTVTRALSLGEVDFPDLPKVVVKELLTALLCSIALGIVCFGKIMLLDGFAMGNEDITVTVAMTVSIALSITIVCAKIVGCVLPILAKKIGADPAVMASPLITTIVDALSLIIYFSITKAILL